jgi:DNA replication protein
MAAFPGFPSGTRDLPVPGPFLGPLLEEITEMAELKCTLRFFWLVAQQKGQPRMVDASALTEDPVLLTALGSVEEVHRGLALAVWRGTLLTTAGPDGATAYLLHTPANERVAEARGSGTEGTGVQLTAEPQLERPNIFKLYEENIGMLTPLLADELRDAEKVYPASWIEDAFKEAVDRNRRNWKYVARILEHWTAEGRSEHGEPGSDSQTITAAEYVRRYGLRR